MTRSLFNDRDYLVIRYDNMFKAEEINIFIPLLICSSPKLFELNSRYKKHYHLSFPDNVGKMLSILGYCKSFS